MPVELEVEGATQAAGTYSKLRPGPGKEASDVAAHQRTRLHAAMIELATERSYESISMRDLMAVAKVSSRTFYKEFSDKQACFESAHEMVSRRLVKRILAAQAGERDPAQCLQRIVTTFLAELARDPSAARLFLVESYVVSRATRARTRRAMRTFEEAIASSFASAPDEIGPSPLVAEGVALGIERIARNRLTAGRAAELPGMAEPLSRWALCHCIAIVPVLADPGWAAVSGGCLAQLPPIPPSGTQREEAGAPRSRGDRALLLSAAAKLAAVQEHRNLDVSLVCATAGVSRPRFYAHFEGIEDCLLAALEVRVREILSRAERAVGLGRDWPTGAYRAVAGICFEIAIDPTFAGLSLGPDTGAVDWGVRGAAQRERLFASIAAHMRREIPHSSVQGLEVEASVEAAWGLLRSRVARNIVEQMPRLAGAMAFFVLTPAVGPERASDVVEAEGETLLAAPAQRPALARVA
jgi:AcrR family transcriptional regulator